MKPIASLYSLKAMGCLFVVMQHLPFAGRGLFSPIINTAVPLFAMISGYFLFCSDDNGKQLSERLLRTLKKVWLISLQVNAVYLIYHLLRSCFDESHAFPLQNWKDLLELFLYGDTLNYALWYLNAYWQALMILWLLSRHQLEKWIRYFPFLLILGVFWGRYLFLFPIENAAIEKILGQVCKNCFTTMLPFMSIGFLLHQKEALWRKFRIEHLWILSLATLFLAYVEITVLTLLHCNNHHSQLFFGILFAICCFVLALHYPQWSLHPFIQQVGKHHSANVYYYHLLVAWLLAWASWVFPAIQAFIVFAATLLLSVVLKNKSIPVSQP